MLRRMESDKPARWKELCEQVSKEQDPLQVLALTQEILRLLQEKEDQSPGRKTNPAV